jgi:hypothetical protein
MVGLANLITQIYANKAELVTENGMLGLKGPKGLPQFIYDEVHEMKDELLEAITADPAQPDSLGWSSRMALYRHALRHLEYVIGRDGLDIERACEVLCPPSVAAEKLNEALLGGEFKEFRAALKEYIHAALKAGGAQPRIPQAKATPVLLCPHGYNPRACWLCTEPKELGFDAKLLTDKERERICP